MKRLRSLLTSLLLLSKLSADDIPQTIQLPPSLSTAGTSAVVNGQSWAYLIWNSNIDGWLDQRKLSVHLQAGGDPQFTLMGQTQVLTDPGAIQTWIARAGQLGEDLNESAAVANQLFNQWKADNEATPPTFQGLLSALTTRVQQDPVQGGAFRQIGQSRPLFRFVSGSGWAGPLNVAPGTPVILELRDEKAKVVGRVNLTAGQGTPLAKPGAPVQVPPDFPESLPVPAEAPFATPEPSTQIDRSVSLRWGIPEALRKQILLTRGFHLWKLPPGYAGPMTGQAFESDPQVERLTGSPALASKIFRLAGSTESGPDVDDFDADNTTWFVVDDNDRYATDPNDNVTVIGTPYDEGDTHNYVVAAVDLLGRFGPVSDPGSGVAVYQVPSQIPDVLRVENIMDAETQRLKVVWKPNENRPTDIPATHYLIYRDRLANAPMVGDELRKSTYREDRKDLIYLGAMPHQDGVDVLTFIDTALTPQSHDYSHPYFYCIRAAHLGPLGYNISRPSPAVFGTLRDRVGPDTPSGHLRPDCPRVGIRTLKDQPDFVGTKALGPDKAIMRFNVFRGLEDGTYNDISWVLVGANLPGRGDSLAPGEQTSGALVAISPALFFGRNNDLIFDLVVPPTELEFSILAVSSSGTISHICSQATGSLRAGFVVEADFRVIAGPIITMEPEAIPSDRHEYWSKYFSAPEVFTPQASGPGTQRGTAVVGAPEDRSKFLLIQSNSGTRGAPWVNRYSARLPKKKSTFHFPALENENLSWRYWEITESPFTPDPGLCPHEARHPGNPGVTPIGVILNLPIDTEEYRIYRRINEGALTLLAQAAKKNWDDSVVNTIIYEDKMIPPAGGQIAYYGQVFDEHGNPSALTLLETRVNALAELPTPILEEIRAGGDDQNPTMIVKAVAPSPGVARLELVISPPLISLPEGLTSSPKLPSVMNFANPGEAEGPPQTFSATYAGPTDPDRDPSEAVILEVEIPIDGDTEYEVIAHCVGLAEKVSNNRSSKRSFTWDLPPPPNVVPWPKRAVPKVIDWDLRIQAFEYTAANSSLSGGPDLRTTSTPPAAYPVAIRIGQIPLTNRQPNWNGRDSNWRLWGNVAQANDLFSTGIGNFGLNNAVGDSENPPRDDLFQQFLFRQKYPHPELVIINPDTELFPFVVYRQQISRRIEGVDEATPDTDIVQASHLVRSIVWDSNQIQPRPGTEPAPPPSGFAFLNDPWIGVARFPPLNPATGGSDASLQLDFCYFDTTPVTEGATYQYYLLHFNELGEPDGIIDAGTVTISD